MASRKIRLVVAGMLMVACSWTATRAIAAPTPIDPPPFEQTLGTGVAYDPDIPTPPEVIGHPVGALITRFDRMVAFIEALEAASDRTTVEVIARTNQERPILWVTSTSPENHARLDEIRKAHLASIDPDGGGAGADDLPAIVQFVHGVHGDEISASESSMLLAYHLAAAQDEETLELLDNTVVLQTITLNPDGFDRYGAWVNLHHAKRPNPDRAHREHRNPWPAGRVNGYWFDLNRQWLPVTQVESRAVVKATHRWVPQVVTDLHEMGNNSTYFYSPGPADNLHPLFPKETVDMTRLLNASLAAQLDSEKLLSVSEEVFDDFYLGYGSSYPMLLGGIGFLFEQSSTDGIMLETVNGLKQYADKIGQQFRVALALSKASMRNRAALRDYQRRFFQEEQRRAAAAQTKAWVVQTNDRARLAAFHELLSTHDIRAHELVRSVRAPGPMGERTFEPATSLIVPANQKYATLIEGIFETRKITDKVEFYDVSGWTLPLSYGLDMAPLRANALRAGLVGNPVESIDIAWADPDRAALAYVFEWTEFTAPRALYRLLEHDLRAKVVPDPITLRTADGTVDLTRGAIVVPVAQDDMSEDALHALMTRIATEDGVEVHATATAVTPKGSDLGGFELTALTKPKVLLVSGLGTSQYNTGELWFLLDQHVNMPVTMIDSARVGRTDLRDYTHIVLAGGRYDALDAKAVKTWVRTGGTLVAVTSGAEWAVANGLYEVEMLDVKKKGDKTGTNEAGKDKAPAKKADADAKDDEDEKPKRLPYAEKREYEASRLVSGAIFAADLDTTHPIGWGHDGTALPLHREGWKAFKHTKNPFAMVVQYAEEAPLLAGYASEENQDRVAGLGSVMADRVGRGAVVLFADKPFFRAYWYGTAKLFVNSLFFSKAMSSHRTGPYEKH